MLCALQPVSTALCSVLCALCSLLCAGRKIGEPVRLCACEAFSRLRQPLTQSLSRSQSDTESDADDRRPGQKNTCDPMLTQRHSDTDAAIRCAMH
ncbi:hypothetical protein B484DRAFT_457756 [Ochromonadaceae sp. CCMP2298]|nr:hypothetical protein B484DRAFT_457756 [Ochromonadaceae sp. CCMP2298]